MQASRLPTARAAARLAVAAAVGSVVAWEVARPTLPVPFELDTAARVASTMAPWTARLPMAIAAVLGLLAVYTFIARTMERRAAAYAVAVLATTPAWFVHGRTMTGAILPMAAAAIVLAGSGLAVLDPNATLRTRAIGAAAAAFAMLAWLASVRLGVPSRGLLVVAGIPLLSTGLAGLYAARVAHAPAPPRIATRAAAAFALAGVAIAVTAGASAIFAKDTIFASWVLGVRTSGPATAGLHAPVTAIAYGLVPWSPFVPFALARRPASPAHLAIIVAAMLSLFAHAATSGRAGPAPIVGVAAVATSVALMLRNLEETRRVSVAFVAAIVAIAFLVAHDVTLSPDRALVLFGATDVAIPAGQAAASSLAIRSAVWVSMVLTAVALLSPQSWLPAGRGLATIAAGVLAGLVLRAHAYPDILARLSPGAAFDAWARAHRTGEPLGLVGVDRRVVAFAPGTAIVPHRDARSAGKWLATDEPSGRKFLAVAATELPRVNAEWRATRGGNVPILAGKEGSTLLATSALASGEHSDNPLEAFLPGAPPAPRHSVGAVLDDRLEAVGWDLVDGRGAPLDALPRRKKGRLRIALRVMDGATKSPVAGHCTFIHVDHTPTRFAVEHREHPYPMTLWRTGDVVVDEYEIDLPPHFRAGRYPLFFGVGVLPCEDDRRMHVTNGPNDGRDRVPFGHLEVR